ncbi:MAG: glycine cleavage system aminomethyltransferase GcvT [Planctomycetes bacterium]|nr:glycine cleavage system aminomethyltransferase GcvT [Planctomycetota bacterium]
MEQVQRTVFYQSHVDAGAKMVDFAGWKMPIQYSDGIVTEHLLTRKHAGLFDVSHMGRFQITGSQAIAFLQYVLTNDCAKLAIGQAQYTILANKMGGAVDDAFLYCPEEGAFLLVVNASNKDKDWEHLQKHLANFPEVQMDDVSDSLAMIALQGPESETILRSLVTDGMLPKSKRNALGSVTLAGVEVLAARTGYTGESVCFELFIPLDGAVSVWNKILGAGAKPVGLGARDTLRLEAGLPLYGHELGMGRDDRDIPVFAIGLAVFAVSFEDASRGFIGRGMLEKQAKARGLYKQGQFSQTSALPKVIRQFQLSDKGIAREGAAVYHEGRQIGWVSSGTMVPYWEYEKDGKTVYLKQEQSQRAIGLCMVEPQTLSIGRNVEIEVRGRMLKAVIVARNMENRKTKMTYALLTGHN